MPNVEQVDTPFRLGPGTSSQPIYTSHKLCHSCKGIFLDARLAESEVESSGRHLETLQALEISASEGCQLCLMVVQAARLRKDETEECESPTLPSSTWKISYTARRVDFLEAPFRFFEFDFGSLEARLFIHYAQNGYSVSAPIMSNNAGSEASLQAAKQWLSECHSTHARCNQRSSDPSWLPTRLIDTGPLDFPGHAPPRLRTRDQIAPGTRYFTLSHRWITDTSVSKLTQASLAEFLREIPTSALTEPFLDAMRVVRSLGYRHIWIDALCIIQDSREDWRRECSRMGDVYRNSLCNISKDTPAGGLFGARDPRALELIVIKYKADGAGEEEEEEEEEKEEEEEEEEEEGTRNWVVSYCYPGDETRIASASTPLPLYHRGWVIQEWFMAPRILHFGARCITWECVAGSASEAHPESKLERKVFRFNDKRQYEEDRLGASVEACLRSWFNVLVVYTNTDVTVPSDKLPAISAVAKDIGRHLRRVAAAAGAGSEVEYLAGLFSSVHFEQQLLWISNAEEMARRPAAYRAPSWSWASLDATVAAARPKKALEDKVLLNVLERRVFPAGEDPFQEVLGGHIRVQCWLWRIRPSQPLGMFECEDGIQIRYDVADEAVWRNGNTSVGDRRAVFLMPVQVDAKPFSQTLPASSPECYIPRVRIRGLALAREATKDGLFRRAGTFIVEAKAEKVVSIDTEGPDWKKAAADRVESVDIDSIISPMLHHAEGILSRHNFDKDLDPTEFEESVKDTRFKMGAQHQLGEKLYTITII